VEAHNTEKSESNLPSVWCPASFLQVYGGSCLDNSSGTGSDLISGSGNGRCEGH